ncbi:MAG: flagellar protein FlaG [Fervidobacterium sp.]
MDSVKGIKAAGNELIVTSPGKKEAENLERTNQETFQNSHVIQNLRKPEKKVEEEIDIFKENFEKLKKLFRGEAEFKIDRETNMVVIKIKDPETGEVIRQIPPELAVKLAKNIQELLGILMDERV